MWRKGITLDIGGVVGRKENKGKGKREELFSFVGLLKYAIFITPIVSYRTSIIFLIIN